jgi:hypothetical protein
MNQLTLLIYLDYDPKNPQNDLISRARYIEKEDYGSLLGRDGVIQLSNNALLFDQTKSHDVIVQLCNDLISIQRPYLIVALEANDALRVGPLSKEAQASLKTYGVPVLCPPSTKTS